jgi:putative component of membrane protein insertase Oxa1/YidC/SpoIIIJ protein YidD
MLKIREVKVIDMITHTLISPMLLASLWIATPILLVKILPVHPAVIYTAAAVLSYYPLKWTAIGAVLAYKAFAPMSVRSRCRFTPSCSTYMIMSIYKFGLLVGVVKGIRRILRCKPPNGGEDYP